MLSRAVSAALLLASAASSQPRTFDAASVKPSSSAHPAVIRQDDPVSFSAPGMTLNLLIGTAYDVLNEQISGGHAWAKSDRFDIEAKAAAPATKDEKMQMLGALLADRFQLKFHREPLTLRAYALVIAKDGLKMQPAKPDAPPPVFKPGLLAARNMKQLVSILNQYIRFGGTFPGRGEPPLTPPDPLPVFDQTGLTSDYDIALDMSRSTDWFVVLEQQLGLKLEPQKVTTEMLIIDSAARPSGN